MGRSQPSRQRGRAALCAGALPPPPPPHRRPVLVAWCPFNESGRVPNLPDNVAERHYVQALYHLTHTLDPTRPVIGNDGWESVATDILGIHDYDHDPERLARRYRASNELP